MLHHILLFEAFESKILSNTFNFLKNKIGKSKSLEFIKSIKELLNYYDIPLDEISDDDLEYLPTSKSLKISTPDRWEKNSYNIYCFKFWFSIDKGYLGHTEIGNEKIIENPSKQVFKDSDFGIILKLDDILKKSKFKKISTITTKRSESKKGALKFIKDVELKKINLKRYADSKLIKMGITVESKELKNLQAILLKYLCGDFALPIIYMLRAPNFRNCVTLIDWLKNLINPYSDNTKKEFAVARIGSMYSDLVNDSDKSERELTKGCEVIKEFGTKDQKEFLDIIIRSGRKLKNYLNSKNITTIEEFEKIYFKIRKIDSMYDKSDFKINYLTFILNSLNNPEGLERSCRGTPDGNHSANDIERIKLYEEYIDSIIIE